MLHQQLEIQRFVQEAEHLRLVDQVDDQFRVLGFRRDDGEDFRMILFQQFKGGY